MAVKSGDLVRRERSAIVRPQEAARLLQGPEAVFGVILAGIFGLLRGFLKNTQVESDEDVRRLGEAMGLVEELEYVVGKIEKGKMEGRGVEQLEAKARDLVKVVREKLNHSRIANGGDQLALTANQRLLLQGEAQTKDRQIELLEKEKRWFQDRAEELEREKENAAKEFALSEKKAEKLRQEEVMSERGKLKKVEGELLQLKEELVRSEKRYAEASGKNDEVQALRKMVTDKDKELSALRQQQPFKLSDSGGDSGRSDAILDEVTKNIEAESLALGADVKRAEVRSRGLSGEKLPELDRVSLEMQAEEEGLRAGLKKAEATLERAQTEEQRKKKAVDEILGYAEGKSEADESPQPLISSDQAEADSVVKVPMKKKRGRPQGSKSRSQPLDGESGESSETRKRKRGRPRRNPEAK